MLDIPTQIERGLLVCPRTRQRLRIEGSRLITQDGLLSYPYEDGVPVLVDDPVRHGGYRAGAGEAMYSEYRSRGSGFLRRAFRRLRESGGDHRSPAAATAFEEVVGRRRREELCVSVGGGPRRVHPNLVNLNLDRFENVDVVGDAYALPYADASVDAVHCEAVLEHLEFPDRAVAEMYRVLRPGGEVFAATPFLQAYHAYPRHYQNFTREGHDRLFERAGFEVVSSGACVGPTFALTDLTALYLRHYAPTALLGKALQAFATTIGLALRPIDRWLHLSAHAHVLASTVFARLRKPAR